MQNLDCLGHYFGPDSVPGEHRDRNFLRHEMKEDEKWREFKDSPGAGAPMEYWSNAVEIVSAVKVWSLSPQQ
jgi:hypothetical protein